MVITTHWTSPRLDFVDSLSPGVVHVWQAPLDDSPDRASRFQLYLSDDERERANRYRSPQPQFQFVITRSILRILLSRYLRIPSTHIHFEVQSQGKLILARPSPSPVQFNVSHTRGMALIALTLQHAVGIDVERIDRAIQDRDIAERYFSAREAEHLASMPAPERPYHFFSYWTCKEAYLKMLGRGMAEGLAHCEITYDPELSAARIINLDQPNRGEDCSLYRMTVGPEHIGAVAIASSSMQVSYWKWEDSSLF